MNIDTTEYRIPAGTPITLIKANRRTKVEQRSEELLFMGEEQIKEGGWLRLVPEGFIGFHLPSGWAGFEQGALLVRKELVA